MPDIEFDYYMNIKFKCEECGYEITMPLYPHHADDDGIDIGVDIENIKTCQHYKIEEDEDGILIRKI